jgi:hypothetical protein
MLTVLMAQDDEDRENLIAAIIVLCPTINSVRTGREVLAEWSTEDLVAFHAALRLGLLEREVSATLKARDETAWGKSWALSRKLHGNDAA